MTAVYVGDVDMTDVKLSKPYLSENPMSKQASNRVDIRFAGDNKLAFSLCSNFEEPYATAYAIDRLSDDGRNQTARVQKVLLQEAETVRALQALDELIVGTAIAHAAEWFPATPGITPEEVRARYHKIVFSNAEDLPCMKFKVKVQGHKTPTRLHHIHLEGMNKGCIEDLEKRGAKVAPILSAFMVWFNDSSFGVSFQAEEMAVVPGTEELMGKRDYPHICGVDLGEVHFSKMYVSDQKRTRVDITVGKNERKFAVALCSEARKSYKVMYDLDEIKEDDFDKTRRGQKLRLEEEATVQALEALDELVIQEAIANASDWFKTRAPLTEEMIRARYQRTVFDVEDKDGVKQACMKFKVKMDGAKVPTRYRDADGGDLAYNDALDMLEGGQRETRLAPVLSCFGLWFMGGKDPSRFGISFQAEEMTIIPGKSKAPFANFASKRKHEEEKEGHESSKKAKE